MSGLKTLVQDIKDYLINPGPISQEATQDLGHRLASKIVASLTRGPREPKLSLSMVGKPDRQLWYQVNHPELAEPLSPEARAKFLYGDIIEELYLWLAKQSGHEVTREQETVEVNGVEGHIDAFIDGQLVDVKSTSSRGFDKFREHGLEKDDPFGYLSQLDSYAVATSQHQASFLAVGKELGKICLDTYGVDPDVTKQIEHKQQVIKGPKPERCYQDVPDGASGNRKLSVGCSYCPFKSSCWSNLRTYAYSSGPVYLTRVVREPKVKEIK